LQHEQPRVGVGDAAAQQLHVGQVLVGVGVKEALGVISGVGQDLVHLLVEVAPFVGHLHGQAVAVHGVDDAAGGDLGLEQADAVVPDDEILLHGLEEGHLLPCVGVGVSCHGSLCTEEFLLQFAAHQPGRHGLVHRQLLVVDGVNDEPRGRLRLQQHQGRALPQDALPHGLVDAHLLHPAGVGLGGHQHAGDASGSLEVSPHTVHLCYFLSR
ncbi:hypothetical protein N305_10332, partial [Manacus vitellinus]